MSPSILSRLTSGVRCGPVMSCGVAVVAGVAVATAMSGAAGAATPQPQVVYGGSAYGSTASVGSLVHSGDTAYVPMCTTTRGAVTADKTAAVNLGTLGTVGAVTTQVSSSRAGTVDASTTTTHTATSSLLGGLIKLDAISTEAQVKLSGHTYSQSGSTTLLGLTIAGKSMPVDPAVNQTIPLLGLGEVILNQQSHSSYEGIHTMNTTALEIVIKAGNISALPTGTVIIGHSYATLHTPTYRRAYGSAYGTSVQVGSLLSSGRTASAYLPCGGSNGATRTNSTAAVNVSGVLSASADSSTAHSSDTAKTTTAATTNHLAAVSLLGGAVTLDAITTAANASRTGSHLTLSDTGTRLVGLKINGTTQTIPSLGTSRTIAGLGTLYFGAATKTRSGIQVYGLRLVLSAAHGSLAAGASITIGSADAGITG
jgi:hypothetical protein